MATSFPITAVIINYQTPDLTKTALTSFRKFYPQIPILLIDNGSKDNTQEVLKRIIDINPDLIKLMANEKNLHHGPAMHQAIGLLQDEFILFLDSDCEVLKSGFVEKMRGTLESDSHNYVVGKLIHMNKRGFDVAPDERSIKYIRPICMMIRRSLYKDLEPFQYHGAPCLKNMIAANERGYHLTDFNIEEYIHHKGRGTASRFGYNLGLRGKINFILNKVGL
jgi:glycosyltransferase involved in cell wall biosynthesis